MVNVSEGNHVIDEGELMQIVARQWGVRSLAECTNEGLLKKW